MVNTRRVIKHVSGKTTVVTSGKKKNNKTNKQRTNEEKGNTSNRAPSPPTEKEPSSPKNTTTQNESPPPPVMSPAPPPLPAEEESYSPTRLTLDNIEHFPPRPIRSEAPNSSVFPLAPPENERQRSLSPTIIIDLTQDDVLPTATDTTPMKVRIIL